MIIITITSTDIIVEAMQMGIKYHIATYSKRDHSEHSSIDFQIFTIKNGRKTVFECYLPIVMYREIEK